MEQRRQIDSMFLRQNTGLRGTASQFFESMVEHTRPWWAEQQQTQQVQRQVAQEYAASTRTAELLEHAYDQQTAKNREAHRVRFMKGQDDQTSETPPESPAQNQAVCRKTAPKRAGPQSSTPTTSSVKQEDPGACPQTS